MAWFKPKEQTPTGEAAKKLESYFRTQGIDIRVYANDEVDPTVQLKIEPGGWNSVFANVADAWAADEMANNTQKAGFLLGKMSIAPGKPRSVEVGYNTIQAPTGAVLFEFIDRFVTERQFGGR